MPFFEVSENCSFHLYNIGCLSMIYRLKYAKSESNFDADFEHPTFQGVLLQRIVFLFRAYCCKDLLTLQGVLLQRI